MKNMLVFIPISMINLGMEVSCNTKGLKLYKKVKTELDTVEKNTRMGIAID
jgi:hypothetical protein